MFELTVPLGSVRVAGPGWAGVLLRAQGSPRRTPCPWPGPPSLSFLLLLRELRAGAQPNSNQASQIPSLVHFRHRQREPSFVFRPGGRASTGFPRGALCLSAHPPRSSGVRFCAAGVVRLPGREAAMVGQIVFSSEKGRGASQRLKGKEN